MNMWNGRETKASFEYDNFQGKTGHRSDWLSNLTFSHPKHEAPEAEATSAPEGREHEGLDSPTEWRTFPTAVAFK